MSPFNPTCFATKTINPPPIVQPIWFFESEVPTTRSSTCVLIAPMPATPKGCTGPNFGASMKLPINVVTDVRVSASPVNSPSCVHSASKPTTEPTAPREPPQFQFLLLQLVAVWHPESPPKL